MVVAVGTALSTQHMLHAPYVTWPEVSTAWHESLRLPGALAAGFSAFAAASIFTSRSPISLPIRPRLGGRAVATHIAGVAVWALIGHVLGMMPVTAYAVGSATWGHLRILDVLVSLAGLALVVASGFVAGVVIRSAKVAPPLVAIAALVIMQLPNNPLLRPLALLQPVQQWTTSDLKFVPNTAVSVFSFIFAVVGILAAVATADAVLCGLRRLGPAHIAWALAPLVLATVAFAWRPELYVDSGKRPQVCTSVHDVPVCLHEAHAKSLDTVAETVASLQSAGAEPLINSVTGESVSDVNTSRQGNAVISLNLTPDSPRLAAQTVPEQVAIQVSTAAAVPAGPCSSRQHHDLGALVRHRILTDAGYGHVADLFTSTFPDLSEAEQVLEEMSSAQFADFVAQRHETIVACQLTTQDVTEL
ncbi:hypothetical protein [Phytoactinopolyspora halophila]|uniref:Uncharacterized protein n=1 Tax=Phytoactinopolyspora halophila TaxID=1981511 RepID=A0A329QUJ9_9ACTN|nr:hypothetical protein [Phytoactinopolyspora halophila]RAW15696.1 hypothetical protein DPM12_08610 [Phytoactinopolyspora halophila]